MGGGVGCGVVEEGWGTGSELARQGCGAGCEIVGGARHGNPLANPLAAGGANAIDTAADGVSAIPCFFLLS